MAEECPDSVRFVWVRSMHHCANVFASLKSLTNSEVCSGEVPHVELGKTRAARDYKDMMKVLEWFAVNNPFDGEDAHGCVAYRQA
jgi:hypothetical protein